MLLNLSRQVWPHQPKILQPKHDQQRLVRQAWTFPQLPSPTELATKVQTLLAIAKERRATDALVTGAVFLVPPLTLELELANIKVWFPYTRRDPDDTKIVHLLGLVPSVPLTEPNP